MKKAIHTIKNYFENNYEFLAASIIFIIILIADLPFQKTIVLMLEFIVIIEVMKMISDFIKKAKLRLRFVIDIFIIFLIRDVVMSTSKVEKDYFNILFLLFVILIFFIFRILAIKYSPGKKEEKEDIIHEE